MGLTAFVSYFLVTHLLPPFLELRGVLFEAVDVFYSILLGLAVGGLMSLITEYYTSMGRRPVLSIVHRSSTGHATNIIGGLSVGMASTMFPILVLAGGIYGAYELAGLYGIAMAAHRHDGYDSDAADDRRLWTYRR